MARYERIPNQQSADQDNLLFERPSFDEVPLVASSSSSSSSSTTTTTPLPTTSTRQQPTPSNVIGTGNDGVFANLSAAEAAAAAAASGSAQPAGKNFDEMEPPSYQDAVFETSPPYFDSTVVSSFSDDGDVVVEGYPVGNFFTFFVNLIVSMSFDFIGFLLTSMLATSHAAKHGSRSGLGITLIRYGLLLKAKTDEEAGLAYRTDPETFMNTDQDQIAMQKEWVAYMMMLVGFILMIRANADFVRVQRLRAVVLATSEHPPV